MDNVMMQRYAGRAAGAAAAYYLAGKHMSATGALLVTALGWLAGGYIADQYLVTTPK